MAKNAGFSLIEIAVVLLIFTLVLGGVMQYLNAQFLSARLSRMNGDFSVIVGSIIGYAYTHPLKEDGCFGSGAVVVDEYCLPSTIANLVPAQVAIDPWGHPYIYENPQPFVSWGSTSIVAFTLRSKGADADDSADDIKHDVYESELLSHLK